MEEFKVGDRDIKYIHLRRYDPEGNLLPKGGATIAYIIDYDNSADCRKLDYKIARCNYKDVFSRKIGRAIASGRMLKGDYDSLILNKFMTRLEIKQILTNEVAKQNNLFSDYRGN